MRGVLRHLAASTRPLPLLEVETYTWQVLGGGALGDLVGCATRRPHHARTAVGRRTDEMLTARRCASPRVVSSRPAMIRLRDVQKSYPLGTQRVLACAVDDLQINRGEQVALVGRSGTGKTTLLHMLAGILLPDRGEIEVVGQRLDQLSESGARSPPRPPHRHGLPDVQSAAAVHRVFAERAARGAVRRRRRPRRTRPRRGAADAGGPRRPPASSAARNCRSGRCSVWRSAARSSTTPRSS